MSADRRRRDARALEALHAHGPRSVRRRRARVVAGALVALVSVAVMGVGTIGVLVDAHRAQQRGPRAEATVLSVDHGRSGEATFARVRFTAGEREIEADVDLIATRLEPDEGDVIGVAYLADDPAGTTVAAEASMVEQVVVQGAFGLGLAGLGVWAGIRLARGADAR